MNKRVIAYSLLLGLSLASCKHTIEDIYVLPDPNAPCKDQEVYFNRDIEPLLLSKCAMPGCHDNQTASDGVRLSGYNNILNSDIIKKGDPLDSELWEVLNETGNDRMPPEPNPPLTSAEKELIRTWLLQGAPNSACKQDCDSSQFSWSGTIQPLIKQKCEGCHNSASPQSGIILEQYTQVKALVDNGSLEGSITGNGFVVMPYQNPLPACEQQQILNWIADGAPQN